MNKELALALYTESAAKGFARRSKNAARHTGGNRAPRWTMIRRRLPAEGGGARPCSGEDGPRLSCTSTGNNKIAKDHAQCFRWLREASEQRGSIRAQCMLGDFDKGGRRREQGHAEAFKRFEADGRPEIPAREVAEDTSVCQLRSRKQWRRENLAACDRLVDALGGLGSPRARCARSAAVPEGLWRAPRFLNWDGRGC